MARKLALQETFPVVPVRYIAEKYKEHGHFYGAFLAIARADREYANNVEKPYSKLKSRRHYLGSSSEELIRHFESTKAYKSEHLHHEIEAARRRKTEDDRM